MTRKTVTGSLPLFATRSARKLLAAAHGSGMSLTYLTRCIVIKFLPRPYKPNPDYKGKWYAPLIDNPAYIGEWKPRKIANPDFFEDLTPVKSLVDIGGVGIELWTMTPNILFDNIYIGHSAEDAKALAAETYDIKHTLEEATSKSAKKAVDEEDELIVLMEDPIGFLRQRIAFFLDDLRDDPVEAFKTHPETAGALVVSAITFVGMLLALAGIIGGQQQPVRKVSVHSLTRSLICFSQNHLQVKKAAEKVEKKVEEVAPSASATGKKEDETLKKRGGK